MKNIHFIVNRFKILILIFSITFSMNSCKVSQELKTEVYETSANGNSLKKIAEFASSKNAVVITLNPEEKFQTITGFGGSFTEASASLLNRLSPANRKKILEAYFGENGAKYSLTRTHIASCDFSLSNYTYAKVENDKLLENFTIEDDKSDLIPMILEAKAISKEGFKIIASPWTSPPWMKDNKKYVGGKLLPEYNDSFAFIILEILVALFGPISATKYL
jgi:glucosylceramidase